MAVAQGRSNAEIRAVLFLSVPTVKTHVSSILTKLDLNNRVQITLLALRRRPPRRPGVTPAPHLPPGPEDATLPFKDVCLVNSFQFLGPATSPRSASRPEATH